MSTSSVYVLIAILSLAVVAVLLRYLFGRKFAGTRSRLSPLAGLAFGFVLAGLFVAENRILGYSLIGAGIILSIVDIILKMRKEQ